MTHPRTTLRRLVATATVLAAGAATLLVAAPAGAAPTGASSGCGRPAALSSGSHTLTSGGQSRSYTLDVPDGYDPDRPYRLVVGLHWLNGGAGDVVNGDYYGLKPLADGSTVFVAPQGLNAGWANSGGRDVSFVDDVLAAVESALCIDTTQRFALGFSFGGAMSNALACARPETFRAVAAYGGGPMSGCSGGTAPVAYLGVHGVVDNVVPISWGRDLRDRFVKNNGCTAQSPREPAAGSGTHVRTAYTGCADGKPVEWIAFDGDHWFTPRDNGAASTWVPAATWAFFTSLPSTLSVEPAAPAPTSAAPAPTASSAPAQPAPSASPTPSRPVASPSAAPAATTGPADEPSTTAVTATPSAAAVGSGGTGGTGQVAADADDDRSDVLAATGASRDTQIALGALAAFVTALGATALLWSQHRRASAAGPRRAVRAERPRRH